MKMTSSVLGMGLFVLGCSFSFARQWTNLDGRVIEADLKMADGSHVTLIIKGREVRYPLDQLCEADREFASEWIDKVMSGEIDLLDPERGRSESDPVSKEDPAIGSRSSEERAASETLVKDVPRATPSVPSFEVLTVSEDADAKKFVYSSPHFTFESDRRLTSRVVRGFSSIYEGTYEAIRLMPWGIPLGTKDGMAMFSVRLFSDESEFQKAGGVKGSAGTAVGVNSLALIEHLGVRDTGSRLILEDIEDNHVLIHELTHAIRNYGDRKLPIWAVEGFAEYMASAPYRRGGRLSFSDRLKDGVAYVRLRKGVGGSFEFPVGLEAFMDSDRKQFYQTEGEGLTKGALPFYASALLTMNYFWHVDQREEDSRPGERIRLWLSAISNGTSEAEARDLLLDGRSYEEIEKEIAKAYRRHLDIEFP